MSEDCGISIADPENEVEKKHHPLWNVIILNDDYTPMEFVVKLLMVLFHHSEENATMLMLDIHTKGRAIVGQYTRDIAETKASTAVYSAREADHPLQTIIEPSEI